MESKPPLRDPTSAVGGKHRKKSNRGGPYVCEHCNQTFTVSSNYNRHLRAKTCRRHRQAVRFYCESCGESFARRDNLSRHIHRVHNTASNLIYSCGYCQQMLATKEEAVEHRRNHLRELAELDDGEGDGVEKFIIIQSAHGKRCLRARYVFSDSVLTPDDALYQVYQPLVLYIDELRLHFKAIKAATVLHLEFLKVSEVGELTDTLVVPIRSTMHTLLPRDSAGPVVMRCFVEVRGTIEEFVSRGSGWAVNDVLYMDLEVVERRALNGGCGAHVLGKDFQTGTMSVLRNGFEENEGSLPFGDGSGGGSDRQDCFYLAVARHFLKTTSTDRLAAYVQSNIKCTVETPVSLDDIPKFEEDNQALDLSVSVVIQDEEDCVYPVLISKRRAASNSIVLLLVDTAVKVPSAVAGATSFSVSWKRPHYVYVEAPNQVLGPKYQLADGTTRRASAFFCLNCFNHMTRRDAYREHIKWCHQKTGRVVRMPEEGETVSFINHHNSFKNAFIAVYDFETLQVPTRAPCSCSPEVLANTREAKRTKTAEEMRSIEEETLDQVCISSFAGRARPRQPKLCNHKTQVLYEHKAFAYALLLLDRTGKVVHDEFYAGEDAAVKFLRSMIGLENEFLGYLKSGGKPIVISDAQRELASRASLCYLCDTPLGADRVLDHDHVSGEFLGVAHDSCNLQRREKLKIVAFAHNFSGYDSHLIIPHLTDVQDQIRDTFAIPLNTQKFKMLKFNRLVFLDSTAFLPDSLSKLVDTLKASNHTFPILAQRFPRLRQRELLTRKGVYPYSYATSIERLLSTTVLPPKQDFINLIGAQPLAEGEYEHAQAVWKYFRCENMMDYTRLYVISDVYLLAEAITELRDVLLADFELDLCHYLSLPMMTKDIMLKTTGASLELIADQEMSELIQSGIRGGLSFINTRHASARSTGDDPRCIVYLDANNLYGYAMSHCLPLEGFEWMSPDDIENFDARRDVTDMPGPGFILEVTLRYPEHLHLQHNSFPLAPESMEIRGEELSPYASGCLKTLTGKQKYKARKLTATFHERSRYLVHGANLKLYLELGMQLVTIHRGIKFYQEAFIKPYISMCTRRRAEAKTKSRSDIMKGLSNSLYGKVSSRPVVGDSRLLISLSLSLSLSR